MAASKRPEAETNDGRRKRSLDGSASERRGNWQIFHLFPSFRPKDTIKVGGRIMLECEWEIEMERKNKMGTGFIVK